MAGLVLGSVVFGGEVVELPMSGIGTNDAGLGAVAGSAVEFVV